MAKPIVLVGEARGEAEARLNSSFVGGAGAELLRMMNQGGLIEFTDIDQQLIHKWYQFKNSKALESIWKRHPEVYRTNVFNQHPPGNNLEWFCGGKSTALPGYPALLKSKYVRAEFEFELDRLCNELLGLDPDLIICLGNTALWALGGRTGITKWRGTTLVSTHCVSDFKVFPTYHPANVMRNWDLRPTVIADFLKAYNESKFPDIRRPEREIHIPESPTDVADFIRAHINGCRLLSVDIETIGAIITCIGFAPDPRHLLVVPFYDERTKTGNYWDSHDAESAVWELIRAVLGDASIPKLFQNGLYDIAFLWRANRIKVLNAKEDTMLLSHALQPEALKRLDYLGSLYSNESAWKAEYRQGRKRSRTIKREA